MRAYPNSHRFAGNVIRAIPSLRNYDNSLSRNPADVDDMVQSALTGAWAHQGRYKTGTNLEAWLATILRNAFHDMCRKRRWEILDQEGLYAQRMAVPPEQQSK